MLFGNYNYAKHLLRQCVLASLDSCSEQCGSTASHWSIFESIGVHTSVCVTAARVGSAPATAADAAMKEMPLPGAL